MLEFLRKHQGTMWIVVTVVVIISFVFFGSTPNDPKRSGPEDTAFTIYGKDYSFDDLARLQRFYGLSSSLGLTAGRESWADLLGYLAQRYQTMDRVPIDFAFNLIVLRKELEKHRIYVTDSEVKEAFRALPAFQGPNGFDGSRAEFFQNDLGSMGFRLNDLYDLLRDWIGFQKLQSLVAGNYVTSGVVSTELYNSTFQTIKAASVPFALETYKKSVEVSKEEIQKYFDENKDNYQTSQKRALSYVLFEKPVVDKLSEEDKVKTLNEYGKKVNDFALAAIQPNAKLEDEAKKANVEVKTLPLFSMDAPPEAIKEETALVSAVFRADPTLHKVSDPVDGNKGYYLFTVSDMEAPKPQELANVTDTIKETLAGQKAQEAMAKASNEARQKIEEAVKGGKKFEEAAKEAGVTPQVLAEFSPANPLTDLSNGREIANEARSTPAGSFTKSLTTDSGVILVFVLSKELRKREDSAAMKTNIEGSVSNMAQMDVFHAWFDRRRDESDLKADPIIRRAMAGLQ